MSFVEKRRCHLFEHTQNDVQYTLFGYIKRISENRVTILLTISVTLNWRRSIFQHEIAFLCIIGGTNGGNEYFSDVLMSGFYIICDLHTFCVCSFSFLWQCHRKCPFHTIINKAIG